MPSVTSPFRREAYDEIVLRMTENRSVKDDAMDIANLVARCSALIQEREEVVKMYETTLREQRLETIRSYNEMLSDALGMFADEESFDAVRHPAVDADETRHQTPRLSEEPGSPFKADPARPDLAVARESEAYAYLLSRTSPDGIQLAEVVAKQIATILRCHQQETRELRDAASGRP